MNATIKTSLALIVALSAALPAQSWTYNDGGSLQRALTGNSVIGALSDGVAYCEYHAPNSGIFRPRPRGLCGQLAHLEPLHLLRISRQRRGLPTRPHARPADHVPRCEYGVSYFARDDCGWEYV